MITNKDLLAFGREQEEKRQADRCIYLLHRIRIIEDDMKVKLEVAGELRREYDKLMLQRGLKSQLNLLS